MLVCDLCLFARLHHFRAIPINLADHSEGRLLFDELDQMLKMCSEEEFYELVDVSVELDLDVLRDELPLKVGLDHVEDRDEVGVFGNLVLLLRELADDVEVAVLEDD